MENKLKPLRARYELARSALSYCNKLGLSKSTKSHIMTSMNQSRAQLLREIRRVSWLLWPETGRPYCGNWVVRCRLNGRVSYTSDLLNCLRVVSRMKNGDMTHWIEKKNGT